MSRALHVLLRVLLATAVALLPACRNGGGGGGSNPPPGAPRIDRIDPASGPVGRGVTISGANFETDRTLDSVFFGGAQASVLSSTTTEVVCEVPAGAPSGAVQVTVSTRAGTSSGKTFTVDAQPSGAPSITSLSPASGPIGTSVAISGSGFDASAGGNTVTFNGTRATVAAATATRIDTVVPGGATSGRVVVETASGASNGVTFSVTSTQPVDQGGSGSKGRDYLAASPYTSMLVEVDYIAGFAPDQTALNLLQTRLNERCNKPGGITVQLGDQIPDQGVGTWTMQQVRDLERRYRTSYHAGNTAVLYLVYVNGGFEGDSQNSKVLGVSYTGSSICIFKDAVRVTRGNPLTRGAVEEAVLVHEAGHNLGLVNNGIPMQTPHQDAGHGAHDSNQSCVMYWAVDTSLVPSLLGSIPDQFDAACIADMRAAGGK